MWPGRYSLLLYQTTVSEVRRGCEVQGGFEVQGGVKYKGDGGVKYKGLVCVYDVYTTMRGEFALGVDLSQILPVSHLPTQYTLSPNITTHTTHTHLWPQTKHHHGEHLLYGVAPP